MKNGKSLKVWKEKGIVFVEKLETAVSAIKKGCEITMQATTLVEEIIQMTRDKKIKAGLDLENNSF